MEEIVGYIRKIIYKNDNNNYVVASLKLDQKKDEQVTITGYFKIPSKKQLFRYYGEYFDHPRFGRQFKVENLEMITPNSKEAIIRYLSSPLFKGIGVKSAEVIFDTLGKDCLERIKQNPEIINECDLKDEQKKTIISVISTSTLQEETIRLLVGSGIGLKYIMKMDAIYKDQLLSIIHLNPYQIIKDIDGIPFDRVDDIAFKLGIASDDERRIKAITIRMVKNICYKTKDCYVPKEILFRNLSATFPNLENSDLLSIYNALLQTCDLVEENNNVYSGDIYEAECGIAKMLQKYIKNKSDKIANDFLLDLIKKEEQKENIVYSEEQINAIISGINQDISIITGGPGTGKTTIVKAIIDIYKELNPDRIISMLAPTGRASKRLSSLSSHEAMTIHRFLKWDLETSKFAKNENDPCFGDFMIIDEFSMVDISLFHSLLLATKSYSKILIIGDAEQLPPVSIGNILRDLIDLKAINVTKLLNNYRQDENSGIIPLCHEICLGEIDENNFDKDDVKFIESSNSDSRDLVLKIVKRLVELGYEEDQIQVLSPMYDGLSGIDSLNDVLRNYFNPASENKKEISITKTIYREGDRILQLKNDADNNVFNGDIGKLVEIDDSEEDTKLYISFDDNIVTYSYSDFSNIALGYCISVHKSQGSEYDCVIMPFSTSHRIMLKRKLIYTGLSRAKKKLILLGNKHSFKEGIKVVESDNRKTTLNERILKELTTYTIN